MADSKSDGIKAKLLRLHEACREVLRVQGALTVPAVVEEFGRGLKDGEKGIAEPSIRNKRDGENPYNALYSAWSNLAKAGKRVSAPPGEILAMDDLDAVEDMTLRHQLKLLVQENRALKKQNGMLRQVQTLPMIRIENPDSALAVAKPRVGVVFDEDDIDILKDFLDPRKLRARRLERTEDGGIVAGPDRQIADPGFVNVLERIIEGPR